MPQYEITFPVFDTGSNLEGDDTITLRCCGLTRLRAVMNALPPSGRFAGDYRTVIPDVADTLIRRTFPFPEKKPRPLKKNNQKPSQS